MEIRKTNEPAPPYIVLLDLPEDHFIRYVVYGGFSFDLLFIPG